MADEGTTREPEMVAKTGAKGGDNVARKPSFRTIGVHTHLSVPAGSAIAKPFFKPEYEPCRPLASTLATTRMILKGVWVQHPDFTLAVVHGGGYLPF